jgi:c-di-GMP-binding flagellar brake protein YcgR
MINLKEQAMDDHRRYPREGVQTLVKVVRGPNTYLGTSLNISLSGMACEFPQAVYEEDKALQLSFRLSLKDRPITTWARPIWSARVDDKWQVGFRFESLDSAHHRAIADHLSAVWELEHRL